MACPGMSNFDFYNIYTSTGKICQISYAQKAADSGDTCIGMKSKHGVVFLVEKPRSSPLYVSESDEKIRRVTSSVTMVHSGIAPDAFYVSNVIKRVVLDHKKNFGEVPGKKFLKMYLGDVFHQFTRFEIRVLGVNTLTSVYKDETFSLLHTDCTSRTISYKAMCIGRGARRVKTELEKLDVDCMRTDDMVDAGVKILFMAYDPLKDKEFDIEIGVISPETQGELQKLRKEDVRTLVEKYGHITVDEIN